jgi:hypothetical protein
LMDLAEQEKGSSYIPAPITIGRKENWVRIVNWGRMDLLKTFIVIGREVFCQKKKREFEERNCFHNTTSICEIICLQTATAYFLLLRSVNWHFLNFSTRVL